MDNKAIEEGLELAVQYGKRGGFVPVIVQDEKSLEVLMLGYANELALQETMRTGFATFWKTSENRLWTKGLTSGDLLRVTEIRVDCDQDALLYIVKREGSGACHTKDCAGKSRCSCFYRRIEASGKLEYK